MVAKRTMVSLITSCRGFLALFDDELSLTREVSSENRLRLDGYYYTEWDGSSKVPTYNGSAYDDKRTFYSEDSVTYRKIYFLYENGIMLNGNAVKLDKEYSYETKFRDETYVKYKNKRKDSWGILNIRNDSIQFEFLYCAEVCKSAVSAGKILNDTTFVITEHDQKKNRTINFFYHFKQFSPKHFTMNRQ